MPKPGKFKVFATTILISLGVGALSAFLTRGNMDIYETVKMPPLSPPGVLFPIVWTILYVLMGIGAGLVYLNQENDTEAASAGLFNFGLSLFVNFFWSIFFFNLRAFAFSFIWLILLLYLIIRYTLFYKKVSPLAAYLQIPYILWVLFAGYLNFGITLLNH